MSHQLQQRVAAIRRSARTILIVHGVCWVIGATISVALLFALLDYAIRIEDTGVRVIGSLLCLATFTTVVYRFLYRGLNRHFGDVAIARRIEGRFPELCERLSSAVEFVNQSDEDSQAGSSALRRAVVIKAVSQTDDLDFSEVLDRQPAVRAMVGMTIISLVALCLALLNPLVAKIAVARLANPLGSDTWPRQNELAFVDPPQRLALGQAFDVELVDRKKALPGEVRIHYRYQVDGQWREENELMRPSGDRMLAGKESVTRAFEYRAEGGDDHSMLWHRLEVVEPPRTESVRITLYPPKYTGWTPTLSKKQVRALRGTRVEFRGQSTKRLASARLRMDGDIEVPATVSDDGFQFTIAGSDMILDKSGAYWFELTDSQDLTGGADTRWEIRAVADTPPSVSLEQPGSNTFVTADAVIPLKVLVKDNLAVKSVRLQYSRSDQSEQGEFEIPLYSGPAEVPIRKGASLTANIEIGESRAINHSWELAPLALVPGTLLTVHVVAEDYLPQTGQTLAPRRITIITAVELEDRLAQRQALILNELRRILKMQRDTRAQLSALEIQLTEVGRLEQGDLDNLQAAELNQRQVTRSLTSKTEGVPSHIQALLRHLRDNRVDSPEIFRRMQTILGEIRRLETEHLPVISRELTATVKTLQVDLQEAATTSESENAKIGGSLRQAGMGQDEVIATLERLLGELSQWSDYRRFSRILRQIRRDQADIEQATHQTGSRTLLRDLNELTPSQRADLKTISRRQLELARRFEKVLQGMDQMSGMLSEKDPLAASTLEDALHQARRENLAGQMRASGRAVEQNRVGSATTQQTEVRNRLDELLDILSNRREHELSRLVKKLREAESELKQLRERHRGLQKKIVEAAAQPNEAQSRRELQRLKRELKRLEEEAQRIARRLKRLQADRAGRSAERGAQNVGRSGEAADQGDAGGAEEASKAAEKDLDEAQQQLAEARKKAEADLADEQMTKFKETVTAMVTAEQSILDRTIEMDQLRIDQGQLSAEQGATVSGIARQQSMLEAETREHAEKLKASEAFALVLNEAADNMAQAASQLEQRDTRPPVQANEQSALARLQQLLEALQTDDDRKPENGGSGEGSGGSGGQGGQTLHNLAELKLVKLMQQDINRRTASLEAELHGKEPDIKQAQVIERLTREQGRLADVIYNLLEPSTATAEDDPEKLPDFRDDNPLEDELPKFKLEEE